ncbi:hypothetical protein HAX54_042570, partial [Datura stramonium]|nr:hypothetical protein [Datura stramonium]
QLHHSASDIEFSIRYRWRSGKMALCSQPPLASTLPRKSHFIWHYVHDDEGFCLFLSTKGKAEFAASALLTTSAS